MKTTRRPEMGLVDSFLEYYGDEETLRQKIKEGESYVPEPAINLTKEARKTMRQRAREIVESAGARSPGDVLIIDDYATELRTTIGEVRRALEAVIPEGGRADAFVFQAQSLNEDDAEKGIVVGMQDPHSVEGRASGGFAYRKDRRAIGVAKSEMTAPHVQRREDADADLMRQLRDALKALGKEAAERL